MPACPTVIEEFATRAVDYIRRALDLQLTYDSETLPILDHYLRQADVGEAAALAIITASSGAYFGEVVRRDMGGVWHHGDEDPIRWRLELPSGLVLNPTAVTATVIAGGDVEYLDASLKVPADKEGLVGRIFATLGEQPEDVYYSCCGHFDTLQQVEAVLADTTKVSQD